MVTNRIACDILAKFPNFVPAHKTIRIRQDEPLRKCVIDPTRYNNKILTQIFTLKIYENVIVIFFAIHNTANKNDNL